jgi:hypothetical protein
MKSFLDIGLPDRIGWRAMQSLSTGPVIAAHRFQER